MDAFCDCANVPKNCAVKTSELNNIQFCSTHSLLQQTAFHCSLIIIEVPVKQFIRSPPDFSTYLRHNVPNIRTYLAIACFALSVCNIFVAGYLVCNAWSCAAFISLPVSPFRSSLHSHNKVSSPPISCLSTLLMYWPCSTLPSPCFLYRLS